MACFTLSNHPVAETSSENCVGSSEVLYKCDEGGPDDISLKQAIYGYLSYSICSQVSCEPIPFITCVESLRYHLSQLSLHSMTSPPRYHVRTNTLSLLSTLKQNYLYASLAC
ncbi:DEHA2B14058p [Debaryomyces hansenii CBS767]|uniref:DEHA2B14058p n=1 Tax=Debaryomyces hansenii (strain ATCC 36239 / CBS 767 / BCRC 21394 / JCM 1990 / NBRC 0083 / IGC 2968) TaxID=284592 RepID=B5RSV8_DEBHA|nr:DEHA2B14058p [Debaryomyces hansenii CBS767]CAR65495.1 DEHA2B14058p [Debaryomyces hansenii CBS767]|eukprot:XP_002770126.1 DEHA2B14058p [Debaryomyces hansenii CBS767]